MINVTKTFLPPFEEYAAIVKTAWDKAWITNNGELAIKLEERLKIFLGVKNLLFCNNGTTVLQMALKALDLHGEIITTPFSYVATTSAILWESCKPVFVDIDSQSFCIDPTKIESAITSRTQAILATHVYGYPCDVIAIDGIAKKYGLKVIYDAAHAFGTHINNSPVMEFGDISTCSFHATKLFHTGEGGCVIAKDDEINRKLFLYRHFGHIGDEHITVGINGKNSELHAALGLCNLNHIENIMERRKNQWLNYRSMLQQSSLQLLTVADNVKYNYAYFPVVCSSERLTLKILESLRERDIYARRYFYPSLNTLSYVDYFPCPVSEDISKRIICLPLFHDLKEDDQKIISDILVDKNKKNEQCA